MVPKHPTLCLCFLSVTRIPLFFAISRHITSWMSIENAQKCHIFVTTKQLNWLTTRAGLLAWRGVTVGWLSSLDWAWPPDGSMAHLDTSGHQSHGRWPGNSAQVARRLVISQHCSFSAAECKSSLTTLVRNNVVVDYVVLLIFARTASRWYLDRPDADLFSTNGHSVPRWWVIPGPPGDSPDKTQAARQQATGGERPDGCG